MRARVYPSVVLSRSKRLTSRTSLSAHRFDPAFGHVDPALPGEPEHRMFNACVVPPVIRLVEFCHPKPLIVLNNSFGTGAAHRCAEEEQFLNLGRRRVGREFHP